MQRVPGIPTYRSARLKAPARPVLPQSPVLAGETTLSSVGAQSFVSGVLLRFVLLGVASILLLRTASAETPVTPNASREAQALLAFLNNTYGKHIISGQQEGWRGTNALGFELEYIREASGKLPALLSMDLAPYTRVRPQGWRNRRHDVVDHAVDWYSNRNGIVSLCWHWSAPMNERAFYTKETTFSPGRAVEEGTPEHEAVLRDIDLIAAELKLLSDAGVPVLWRPLHEANGRWFWWGGEGPEPFKKLWRIVFERLTHHHKLNNLIWVFSPGAGVDLADWYPGDPFVDIIAPDHYPMDGNHGAAREIFDEMVALGGGTKMAGFGENGPIPAPEDLVAEKVNWLFFITWSGTVLTDQNTKEEIKAFYNHPHVLTLDQLPNLKEYPFEAAGKAERVNFSAVSDLAMGSPARRSFAVAVQDSKGQTVRAGTYKIALTLGKKQPDVLLSGATTADTVNGVAVFPDLAISGAGKGFVLQAVCPPLKAGISRPFDVGPGSGILLEWWTNGSAASLRKFEPMGRPAGSKVLGKAFETPLQIGTNYLARYRGYLLPPVTGSYTFWLANENISQLWLSTNTSPAGKVKIAEVLPATPYAKWPHTHEARSVVVHLEAGKRYYVEALHAQNAGSVQFSVRWRLPNGVEESPIPGARLAAPADYNIVSKKLADAQR